MRKKSAKPCGNLVVKLGVILLLMKSENEQFGQVLGGSKIKRGYFWGYLLKNVKIISL
jgi:hypothetical protein